MCFHGYPYFDCWWKSFGFRDTRCRRWLLLVSWVQVNFRLLHLMCEAEGGFVLHSRHLDGFKCSAMAYGLDPKVRPFRFTYIIPYVLCTLVWCAAMCAYARYVLLRPVLPFLLLYLFAWPTLKLVYLFFWFTCFFALFFLLYPLSPVRYDTFARFILKLLGLYFWFSCFFARFFPALPFVRCTMWYLFFALSCRQERGHHPQGKQSDGRLLVWRSSHLVIPLSHRSETPPNGVQPPMSVQPMPSRDWPYIYVWHSMLRPRKLLAWYLNGNRIADLLDSLNYWGPFSTGWSRCCDIGTVPFFTNDGGTVPLFGQR